MFSFLSYFVEPHKSLYYNQHGAKYLALAPRDCTRLDEYINNFDKLFNPLYNEYQTNKAVQRKVKIKGERLYIKWSKFNCSL